MFVIELTAIRLFKFLLNYSRYFHLHLNLLHHKCMFLHITIIIQLTPLYLNIHIYVNTNPRKEIMMIALFEKNIYTPIFQIKFRKLNKQKTT